MKNQNVLGVINEFGRKNGYDGLVNDAGCSCSFDMKEYCISCSCELGYLAPCKDCEKFKDCENAPEKIMGYGQCIKVKCEKYSEFNGKTKESYTIEDVRKISEYINLKSPCGICTKRIEHCNSECKEGMKFDFVPDMDKINGIMSKKDI